MAKPASGVLPSPALKRELQFLVVLMMLVLVPLRALASVTTGFCEFAHGHGTSHAMPAHGAHDPEGGRGSHGSTTCGSCVEHCSSAAFATAFPVPMLVAPETGERSTLHVRTFAGFIPDQLDPPPLAA